MEEGTTTEETFEEGTTTEEVFFEESEEDLDTEEIDDPGEGMSLLSLEGATSTNGYFCVLYSDTDGTCAYYQASTSPLYVQDAGNISFGLAIIITMMAMALTAMLFNSFGGSRRRV